MRSLISEIDTLRFGFKVAKFNINEIDSLDVTLNSLQSLGVRLVITRINANNVNQLNQLESLGFQVKDIQLCYRHHLKDITMPISRHSVVIRCVNPGDECLVESIADEAFSGYGHYFANLALRIEDCEKIYPDWARNICLNNSFADKVFVAEMNEEIAGFIAFKIKDNVGSCQMGATAKKYRNLGVYQTLLNHSLCWGKQSKLSFLEFNVLHSNYSAHRSYANAGCRIENSFCTLHYWIAN